MLNWLPVAPEATAVNAVPLMVIVAFTEGCAENRIEPLAATVATVVGLPKRPFSQNPMLR